MNWIEKEIREKMGEIMFERAKLPVIVEGGGKLLFNGELSLQTCMDCFPNAADKYLFVVAVGQLIALFLDFEMGKENAEKRENAHEAVEFIDRRNNLAKELNSLIIKNRYPK